MTQNATAQLKDLRQSPRKVRLVTDLVKGKRVSDAVSILSFTTKRAAEQVRKLIESAETNARLKKIEGDLVVHSITVNEGRTLYRGRPAAQGQMKRIRKRTSHIYVELAPQKVEHKKEDKKAEKKEDKKTESKGKKKTTAKKSS